MSTINVDAIVSTGGSITSVVIGGDTYTGSASDNLSTALNDNSSVVMTDYIYSGGKLTKQGITVIGGSGALLSGNVGASGAAMQTSGGTSYLSGLTFSDNSSTGYGGAFYNSAVATVSNTLFANNTASRGGAVHCLGTLTVFNDCVFASNTGSSLGGAINRYDTGGDKLTKLVVIHGGTFKENTSATGGAIINSGRFEIGASIANGKDVLFEKNRTSAAIVNLDGATVAIGHATFDGNTKGAIENRSGGVLYVTGLIALKTSTDTIANYGTITIKGGDFLSDALRINKVVANPGGVNLPTFGVDAGTLGYTVTTAKLAGDLYVLQDGLTITPIVSRSGEVYQTTAGGTTFYGNGYSDLATALAANSTVVVTGYTISEQTSTMFISGKTLIGGSDVLLADNLVGGTNGGPLSVTNVSLSGMTFFNNQGRNGGSLDVAGTNNTLSGLVFVGNLATASTSYGGAVYSSNGSGIFSNSVFIGNNAVRGGAVSLGGGTNTFDDCLFVSNTGSAYGGAINRYGAGTQTGILLVVHGGTFKENASSAGGAIVNSGRTEIGASLTNGRDALFEKNRTSAAFMNMGGATASFGHVTFDGNTKGAIENRANGIAYINGLITLKTSADIITNNGTITVDGAAFLPGATVAAKVIDTEFSGSFLSGSGTLNASAGYQNLNYANDLYVTRNSYTVAGLVSDVLGTDTVTTLTVGETTYVGGVYDDLADALAENPLAVLYDWTCSGGTQTLLTGGTAIGAQNALFTGNSASYGGAVRITGTAELSGLTFSGNSASGAGGALYTNGSSVVSKTTFSGNSAASGGAFHLNGTTATFRDVDWVNNHAATGGALQNNVSDKPGQEVRIYGGTFSGNSAGNGGAIFNRCVTYIAKSQTTGKNALFDGNLGSHAIVNDRGTVYLSDVIFRNNANALNNAGGSVYISGSTFATASDGIYTSNGTLEFSDHNFLNAGIGGAGRVDLASNAALTFDNTAAINIIGLTFSGSNALKFDGSAAVNFVKSGGQDLSAVAITVDGSQFVDEPITVATGVTAIGDSWTITGKVDEHQALKVDSGSLVMYLKGDIDDDTCIVGSFTGGTYNLMTGGTVTKAFFGTDAASGDVTTTVTGGTVDNALIGGAKVTQGNTADLGTVTLNLSGNADIIGGTANGGMLYTAGYAYGKNTTPTETDTEVALHVDKSVLNLSAGSVPAENLYAGAHARQGAKTQVTSTEINVSGGTYGRIYGGGWGENYGRSEVGSSTIAITGGTLGYIYAGGGNSVNGASVVTGNVTIDVSGSASVGIVFLAGKNQNCSIDGNVTMTVSGPDKTMTRISGWNANGDKNTAGLTTLNVETNLNLQYLDNVKVIRIAEGKTMDVSTHLWHEAAAALTIDFDLDETTGANWVALSGDGMEVYQAAQYTIDNGAVCRWNSANDKLIYEATGEESGYKLEFFTEGNVDKVRFFKA